MTIDSLLPLKSQFEFAKSIVHEVLKKNAFVVLNGDSISGRSTICELVINDTDSKLFAIFVPCSKQMTLAKLRELVQIQLFSNIKLDNNQNLSESIVNHIDSIKQKVLIVIDNIDSVVPSFFKEIVGLSNALKDKADFSFLITSRPTWVEAMKNELINEQIDIIDMKPLDIEDSLKLSKSIFDSHGLTSVFLAYKEKIEQSLNNTQGHIGQIIKQTERFMKDPNEVPVTENQNAAKVKDEKKEEKKKSPWALLISVICLILILACLSPLFFGLNLFNSSSENTNVNNTTNNTNNTIVDTGILPDNIPNQGIENDSNYDTNKKIVIDGKALDAIEKTQGAESKSSDYPKDKLGSNTQGATVVQRANNELRAQEIEQRLKETKQKLIDKKVVANKAQSKSNTTNTKAVKQNTAKATVANKTPKVLIADNVPYTGQAIPGGSIELKDKANNRYTLQIVAGSDKQKIIEVSKALVDRYWIYQTSRDGMPWYVLITGDYASSEQAIEAAKILPAQVKAAKPFAKSFGTVKQEMLRK